MRLYKTDTFTSKHANAKKTDIITVVFSDAERETIEGQRARLVQLYKVLKQEGQLSSWNKYDDEALNEILVWTTHYKDGGKMQDLTVAQIAKVQMMIDKLFADFEETTFRDLMELEFDEGWDEDTFMTRTQMAKEMDRRRGIARQHSHHSIYADLFDV